jgi:hypothetical protein
MSILWLKMNKGKEEYFKKTSLFKFILWKQVQKDLHFLKNGPNKLECLSLASISSLT